MPVEKTIEKAKIEFDSGNLLRAKQILKSSLANYGFSPGLFRAYADVLLALDEPVQAGRYLFFSIDTLIEDHRKPVEGFLSKYSNDGYERIILASPAGQISSLSDLPEFSRQKLRDLGAPEDLSELYSEDYSWRWLVAGCSHRGCSCGDSYRYWFVCSDSMVCGPSALGSHSISGYRWNDCQ